MSYSHVKQHPGIANNRQPDPPTDQTQFPTNPADRTGIMNQCAKMQTSDRAIVSRPVPVNACKLRHTCALDSGLVPSPFWPVFLAL